MNKPTSGDDVAELVRWLLMESAAGSVLQKFADAAKRDRKAALLEQYRTGTRHHSCMVGPGRSPQSRAVALNPSHSGRSFEHVNNN